MPNSERVENRVSEPSVTEEKIPKVHEVKKQEEPVRPTVIMTEIDSNIHERMKGQPQSLDEIDVKVPKKMPTGLHRMSLPPYFEMFSFDCTRGDSCDFHKKERKDIGGGRWHMKTLNHGKYVFRWLFKNQRAIDTAINVRGWYLVNRNYFHDIPREIISVSGGVEIGDSILAFMPVQKALQIRNAPAEQSRELLNSRMTPDKKDPNKVLMSGNPDDENVYMPDLGKDASETGEGSSAQPGALTEGKDF